ncbi:hypothetical protein Tco_1236988 [Tanacetum coccineum]
MALRNVMPVRRLMAKDKSRISMPTYGLSDNTRPRQMLSTESKPYIFELSSLVTFPYEGKHTRLGDMMMYSIRPDFQVRTKLFDSDWTQKDVHGTWKKDFTRTSINPDDEAINGSCRKEIWWECSYKEDPEESFKEHMKTLLLLISEMLIKLFNRFKKLTTNNPQLHMRTCNKIQLDDLERVGFEMANGYVSKRAGGFASATARGGIGWGRQVGRGDQREWGRSRRGGGGLIALKGGRGKAGRLRCIGGERDEAGTGVWQRRREYGARYKVMDEERGGFEQLRRRGRPAGREEGGVVEEWRSAGREIGGRDGPQGGEQGRRKGVARDSEREAQGID